MADLSAIEKTFVRKLKAFAAGGYAFDDEHALREGTQRKAFDAYTRDFAKGQRHGYFEIPTGVGKTALFTSFVRNYLDAVNGEKDGPRILIAVPSEKLAVQTAQSFAKFIPDIAPLIETDDDKGKEIDWEHSDIGLQYGKMKHAGRKPRILITTYQSLIRDKENKTYPPSEYGMVIYDEGHSLTAEKFGQVTEKFKDAVQLAVTATPEYSEEKTVANRLPHRYFQLPLSEAINKDLCNVRPVLLKTNFTIDEAKFTQLMEQRHGQPLNEKQITSLLNQEVRNNAAMETYLLGKDPDSGEQYLGQNGMIFCGTTDHADDFTRQMDKLISKPKYKAVRQWLEEENIDLIAAVHGKTEKQVVAGKKQSGGWLRAGLYENDTIADRPKRGRKQFYTEEEIFDLHAKGKVLLLSSVAKLKWGYDSPRDSFVMDLVDRLSKVDATQIVGRGFRLDPDNMPDSTVNYPGKTCTVINLVDNNTYDLYKDRPHMLPIYCAEIIEGAEFRTPARRPHLMKRFKKQPPEIDQTLEDSGFRLETDIEAVREESKKYKKAKLDKQEKWKPNDVLSSSELAPKLGIKVSSASQIISKLKAQFTQDNKRIHADFYGIEIPKEAVVDYESYGRPATGIKMEWGDPMGAAYIAANQATDGMWTAAQFGEAAGIEESNARRIIKLLRDKFDQDEKLEHYEYLGLKIPREAIVEYPSAGKTAYGIQVKWGKKIEEVRSGSREKPDNVWSGSEFNTAILEKDTEAKENQGRTIIDRFIRQFERDDQKTHAEYLGLQIPRDALVDYDSNAGTSTGIKKEWGRKIIKALSKGASEEAEYWTPGDLSREDNITETNARHIINDLQRQFDKDPNLKHAEYWKLKVPRNAIVEYYFRETPSYGIKPEWGRKVIEARSTIRTKPDDAWAVSDFVKALDEKLDTVRGMFRKFRKQYDDKDQVHVEYNGLKIPKSAFTLFDHNVGEALAIKDVWAKKIVTVYSKRDAADERDDLKPYPINPRTSPAHQSEEERAEAKRTKHGRA